MCVCVCVRGGGGEYTVFKSVCYILVSKQEVSNNLTESFCMKYQILFSEEKKEKYHQFVI